MLCSSKHEVELTGLESDTAKTCIQCIRTCDFRALADQVRIHWVLYSYSEKLASKWS